MNGIDLRVRTQTAVQHPERATFRPEVEIGSEWARVLVEELWAVDDPLLTVLGLR